MPSVTTLSPAAAPALERLLALSPRSAGKGAAARLHRQLQEEKQRTRLAIRTAAELRAKVDELSLQNAILERTTQELCEELNSTRERAAQLTARESGPAAAALRDVADAGGAADDAAALVVTVPAALATPHGQETLLGLREQMLAACELRILSAFVEWRAKVQRCTNTLVAPPPKKRSATLTSLRYHIPP